MRYPSSRTSRNFVGAISREIAVLFGNLLPACNLNGIFFMYTMNKGLQVATLAATDIETWLRSKPETVSVHNVESEPAFRQIDVDLIWTTHNRSYFVEIKGDRWHTTGNFFFETHSNLEKGTPGCFLYTQADWLFYYFVTPRTLYMLPLPATRDWFVANIDRFRERSTNTRVRDNYYTTLGRLVPISVVVQEVPGVKKEQL